jgi:hypothetical protein
MILRSRVYRGDYRSNADLVIGNRMLNLESMPFIRRWTTDSCLANRANANSRSPTANAVPARARIAAGPHGPQQQVRI